MNSVNVKVNVKVNLKSFSLQPTRLRNSLRPQSAQEPQARA
jgi:hypothetical protein